MWTRQELQIENAKACAQMGIITFDEAVKVFSAIRDGDDSIIEELRRRRDDNKTETGSILKDARAASCAGNPYRNASGDTGALQEP